MSVGGLWQRMQEWRKGDRGESNRGREEGSSDTEHSELGMDGWMDGEREESGGRGERTEGRGTQ